MLSHRSSYMRRENNNEKNKVYQSDAQILAEGLYKTEKINIAYLDPPYNQHQYGSNYHILNTIALWDKPEINKQILINGKKTNKSAIRTDWRTERRSLYNYKNKATEALDKLIRTINSDYVLLSYSTDGHMKLKDILEIMAANGKLTMVTKPYKRYRVSTTRMSEKPYNVEVVFILDKNKTSSRGTVKKFWNEFLEQDRWLREI